MVVKVVVDELHSSAQQHALELLALLHQSELCDDPIVACSMASDMVRFSTELRFRAELAIGRLLAKYPDPGGRPRLSGQATTARELREMLDIGRTNISWLTRLAELVDEPRAESIADELWSGQYPRSLTARSIVVGITTAYPSADTP